MEIKVLVEYQTIDAKVYALENKLNKSENKKKCIELSSLAKESQAKSAKLEEQASQIAKEIQDLFKVADQNKLKIKEILSANPEKMTMQEIENAGALKDKLVQNLNIIDKKATKLAELANSVLSEFNKTKQIYNNAGIKYRSYKEAYDKEYQEIAPKISELKKELAVLEKKVDPKLMEEYKKRRSDRIFPVLVELKNRCCNGCFMELPASSIAKLDRDGSHVCENCRRIIYKA